MTPSFGSYIGGCLSVIGIVSAVGLGGYWLRRWIAPEFSGALARLADATLAVALLVLSLELLGTLSILTLGWTVLVCIGVGLLAAGIGRRMAGSESREVPAPQVQTIFLLIALGVASFVVAEWTFPSQLSLDQGMFGGDTTWYHMPFAARIAQEGSTVHLHFTDPLRLAAWYYPQSSELIHGAGIVLFKTDWLSPLINLVWLSIALLGAWCVGRPYKVGPATLVAGAIILDAGVMIETQPGEGRNDIMGLAFLIAFAALLINGHQRRAPAEGDAVQDTPERDAPLLDKGPLVIAGVAAGLAASVKYTFLIPVVAITLGVVIFSGRGRRFTTAWVLGLSAFVVGGYWYVRAMMKTGGNPIPYSGFGPLHLPQPNQMPLDPRPRFAVADYLTQPTIYRKWFFPRLDNAFGPLWPLILIVAVAAAIFIAVRSRNRILQVIAAAALLTAVVYVFTPLTAAGQEGSPTGFFTNTRYLVPGLVLAMILLPIARPLRAPDSRARQTLFFLLAVYAITVLLTPRWYPGYIFGTVFLTLCLVWAPAGLGLLRAQRRITRGRVAIGLGAVRLPGGRPRARPGGPVLQQPLHGSRPLPPGRWPEEGLQVRPQPARQTDRHRRERRDLLRAVRLLRQEPRQLRPVHRRARRKRELPPGDHLPGLHQADQRRRIRLPDPQPVHDGRAGALPGAGVRLDQERPGAEARDRRDRHRTAARLRLQGQRQAQPGELLKQRLARARGSARPSARAAPTRTCGRRPRAARSGPGSAARSACRCRP